MDAETRARVEAKARGAAVLFVTEHGVALDPGKTDWDGTAWVEDSGDLGLTPHQREVYWPLYQSTMIAESKRLADANGS